MSQIKVFKRSRTAIENTYLPGASLLEIGSVYLTNILPEARIKMFLDGKFVAEITARELDNGGNLNWSQYRSGNRLPIMVGTNRRRQHVARRNLSTVQSLFPNSAYVVVEQHGEQWCIGGFYSRNDQISILRKQRQLGSHMTLASFYMLRLPQDRPTPPREYDRMSGELVINTWIVGAAYGMPYTTAELGNPD